MTHLTLTDLFVGWNAKWYHTGNERRNPLVRHHRVPVFSQSNVRHLPDRAGCGGVREAIYSGQWTDGQPLPTRETFVRTLGVSKNVVQRAVARLVAEGLVSSHARCGCRVRRPCGRKTVRRVLEVTAGRECSFWHTRFVSALRECLTREGILCESVSLLRTGGGRLSFELLEYRLLQRPDILVVSAGRSDTARLLRRLDRLAIPYVLTSGDRPSGRHPMLLAPPAEDGLQTALAAFVADCRRAGIRSVLWLAYGEGERLDPRPLLAKAGIYVEPLTFPPDLIFSFSSLDDVQAAVGDLMRARLRRGPLCNLVFSTDDYMTMGVLPILFERGIRIPEDVRFITLLNKGFSPAFTKTWACIEANPGRQGEALAARIVAWLKGGAFVALPVARAYVRGETFPIPLPPPPLSEEGLYRCGKEI